MMGGARLPSNGIAAAGVCLTVVVYVGWCFPAPIAASEADRGWYYVNDHHNRKKSISSCENDSVALLLSCFLFLARAFLAMLGCRRRTVIFNGHPSGRQSLRVVDSFFPDIRKSVVSAFPTLRSGAVRLFPDDTRSHGVRRLWRRLSQSISSIFRTSAPARQQFPGSLGLKAEEERSLWKIARVKSSRWCNWVVKICHGQRSLPVRGRRVLAAPFGSGQAPTDGAWWRSPYRGQSRFSRSGLLLFSNTSSCATSQVTIAVLLAR